MARKMGKIEVGDGTGILSATLIFCISTADENVEIKLQEKE